MSDTTSSPKKQDPAEVIAKALWIKHARDEADYHENWRRMATEAGEFLRRLEEEGYAIVPVAAASPGR